jgi:acetoin utilization protein AcuB
MRSDAIENFMSHVLVVVDPQQTLAHAARLMRGHEIRHLPVVERGEIVGILSQRDMYLLETLSDTAPEEIRVEEAMTHEPFVVDPEEPLHSVASRMAARRIGSAVVARDQQLLGLFTVTDALRALAIFAHPEPPGVPEEPSREPPRKCMTR